MERGNSFKWFLNGCTENERLHLGTTKIKLKLAIYPSITEDIDLDVVTRTNPVTLESISQEYLACTNSLGSSQVCAFFLCKFPVQGP